MKLRLVDEWRTVLWHSATTRTTALVTYLLGAVGQYYVAGFLAIPYIPQSLQPPAAGILIALIVGGPIIISRLVVQPKLQAKIEERSDGKSDC